jgi:hypothetical protein
VQDDAKFLVENNLAVMTVKKSVTSNDGECKVEGFGAGGFTPAKRAWALTWALLQLAVEIAVMITGSAFVIYSTTNENLILNAVALNFITQIDDTIYRFVINGLMRGWMEGIPVITMLCPCDDKAHDMGLFRTIVQVLGAYVNLAALALTTIICYYSACGTLQ